MIRLIPRHGDGNSLRGHINGTAPKPKKDDSGEKKEAQRKTRELFDYLDTGSETEQYRQFQRELRRTNELLDSLDVDAVYLPAQQFDDTGAVRASFGASNVLSEVTAGTKATNGVKKANNTQGATIDEVTVVGDKNKYMTPHQLRVRDYHESIKEEELAKPATLRRIGAGLDLVGLALSKTPAAMASPFLVGTGYVSNFGADYIDKRNKDWYGTTPESGALGWLDNAILDGTYYGMQLGQQKFPWMRYAKWAPLAGLVVSDTYTLTTGKPLL